MGNREEMLNRARTSPCNWKRRELNSLYEAFGFVVLHGSKHDIVKHIKYLELRATLPRHNTVMKVYVQFAVKLIEKMLEKTEIENETAH